MVYFGSFLDMSRIWARVQMIRVERIYDMQTIVTLVANESSTPDHRGY
jgi:hypothetical protein